MFKYPAAMLTIVAASVFCWASAHADEMMVMPSDGYRIASNSPVNDMDSATGAAHDEDNNVGATRATIISNDDDAGGDIPSSTQTSTAARIARPSHASPTHSAAAAEAVAPPAAAPQKSPTSVRWQSLLPGVMK